MSDFKTDRMQKHSFGSHAGAAAVRNISEADDRDEDGEEDEYHEDRQAAEGLVTGTSESLQAPAAAVLAATASQQDPYRRRKSSSRSRPSSLKMMKMRRMSQIKKDQKEEDKKVMKAKKQRKRMKRLHSRGGVKSEEIKIITHPLDRSLAFAFFVTIFFTVLAIVSGPPLVLILMILLPIGIICKNICSCYYFNASSTNSWTSRIQGSNLLTSPASPSAIPSPVTRPSSSSSSSRRSHHRRKLIPLTPLETFHLNDGIENNNKHGICNCLLFFDKTLNLDQLKDILASRILRKQEFARFTCKLVFKGISRCAYWQKIPLDQELIDKLIFTDSCSSLIHCKNHLKKRVLEISHQDLPPRQPLWQIRCINLDYCDEVALIFRCHQSLCDGMGLMSLLVSQLADQAPPSTTTFIRTCNGTMTATNSIFKPRFGGINFSLNICRAVIVGPLTFFLWIWWAFTRRNSNFLKSFRSTHQNQAFAEMLKASDCCPRVHRRQQHQHQATSNHANSSNPPPHPYQSHYSQPKHHQALTTDADASTASPIVLHSSRSIRNKTSMNKQERCQVKRQQQPHARYPHPSSSCSKDAKQQQHQHQQQHKSFSSSHASTESASPSKSASSKRKQTSTSSSFQPLKSLHWTSIDLPRLLRIKRITRSCLNDVILAAVSGAIREYLVTESGIPNPPDLTISIPVDVRNLNESSSSSSSDSLGEGPGVSFVLLTSPLPTSTEGSIPRLWEIRHLMEEMKASADPAVMFGSHYFLCNLIPSRFARCLLNLIHRNSSAYVSNLQGPATGIAIGSHRLHQLFYWPSTPPAVGISINMMSYQSRLLLSISTTCILIPCAKKLSKLIHKHTNLLADLLSKRRVPGESRSKKRPHHVIIEAPVGSGRSAATTLPAAPVSMKSGGGGKEGGEGGGERLLSASVSTSSGGLSGRISASGSVASVPAAAASVSELTERLHAVQAELNQLNESIESGILQEEGRRRITGGVAESITSRLEDLKDEFSDLMKQLRRRKSIADYGPSIVVNLENDDEDDYDDNDGDLRPASRRYSLVSTTRRSSVVTSAISTFGGVGRRISVSPSTAISSSLAAMASSLHSRPSSSTEPSSPDGRSRDGRRSGDSRSSGYHYKDESIV